MAKEQEDHQWKGVERERHDIHHQGVRHVNLVNEKIIALYPAVGTPTVSRIDVATR